MIREILKMGDPRLLRIADPVDHFDTPELHELVKDMFETMHDANGAGLAAPQIGVNLQVVIFGFGQNERYPDAPPVPETVLINPTITPVSLDMEEGWEGCLSVPGLRGAVQPVFDDQIPRLRSVRQADRSRRRGISRARRAARVRPPDRQALSDADQRLLEVRLH